MLNHEDIRTFCLKKKAVTEGLPFGDTALVFKVAGKIFLILDLVSKPMEFNVKCQPDLAIELREKYRAVLPGYHMNKSHWNTISCDQSLSRDFIFKMIDNSYNLILRSLPKKTRDSLN